MEKADDTVGAVQDGLQEQDDKITRGEYGLHDEEQDQSRTGKQQAGEDEESTLKHLAAEVRDQDELERDVGQQADQMLNEQANERDQKRLDKTAVEKGRLEIQLQRLRQQRTQPSGSGTSARLGTEISRLEGQLRLLNTDLEQISDRIQQRERVAEEGQETQDADSRNKKLPSETQREYLIRTGKITPFSKIAGRSLGRSQSTLEGALLDAEEGEKKTEETEEQSVVEIKSHRNLIRPGFDSDKVTATPDEHQPRKRRRVDYDEQIDEDTSDESFAESKIDPTEDAKDQDSATGESDDGLGPRSKEAGSFHVDFAGVDDGNEKLYQCRLQDWTSRRAKARRKALKQKADRQNEDEQESLSESFKPHPIVEDVTFEGGLLVPGDIYPSLFDYQKTGVQWLWELYSQSVGGVVGDEMGLGKTIQVISFLAALHHSRKLTKPVLIVAPATVMKQWVNEFHTWWPPFRVSILHTSGSGMMDVGREARVEEELFSRTASNSKPQSRSQKSASRIVKRVVEEGHILVTTYSGLQSYAELLLPVDWEYAVLDEGHKIRNPNAAITIYCKELRTSNRIILSGTPMQNNLVELWSLFDYIFPMRLGTLVNFRNQFEIPIRIGGYANASNLQVQTAMRCAEMLKDTISPYLLQRFKADVASDLPQKREQVLFCKLTKPQRDAYEGFLGSDELKSIMSGKRQVLYGIDILRKICNHPDLVEHRTLSVKPGYNYGSGVKSGKMQVVKALLELWKDQGHKTLLFTQHRIMLDVLEKFLRLIDGLKFRRMDGTTPISLRQSLVDDFNENPDAHVFLLTTKVGGLGVNLTGADRVVIYDPDWNPSTDVQARERAWRLGQKREVMIYRLMTSGTIEEKIYHRQLFKQFLINKILRDPKQRQTFQMKDLHDLFTLGHDEQMTTETGELFQGAEVQFNKHTDKAASNGDAGHENGQNNNSQGDSLGEIIGVDRSEKFHSAKDGKPASQGEGAINSDSRLMEGLFARSGVHAALEHDQIINTHKNGVGADQAIIEKEAKRIAAEAAHELRKAGEAARSVPIGTPTWTGEFGVAGRPTARATGGFGRGRGRGGGPSSASVLAGLQARQAAAAGLGEGGIGTSSSTTNGAAAISSKTAAAVGKIGTLPGGAEFMTMIKDFMQVQGGSVHTQMLIDHFNRFCKTPARTAQFKAMLGELATLSKGTGGRGKWVLKEQYRSSS